MALDWDLKGGSIFSVSPSTYDNTMSPNASDTESKYVHTQRYIPGEMKKLASNISLYYLLFNLITSRTIG